MRRLSARFLDLRRNFSSKNNPPRELKISECDPAKRRVRLAEPAPAGKRFPARRAVREPHFSQGVPLFRGCRSEWKVRLGAR